MQIDWWTLAIQAVNFLILVWLLRRFLYGPVKEVIAKRRALAEEVLAKAASREAETEVLKKSLEQERAALAQERRQMLKDIQDQSAAAQEKALEKARLEAAQILADARASIARERDEALSGLKMEIGTLATDLAAGILQLSDAAELSAACFNRLERQLESMSQSDRNDLADDASNGGVTVTTAQALPDGERARWSSLLTGHFGNDLAVRFDVDAALIGGVELRFPHTVLKFTWAERLTQARRKLQGDDTAA